MNNRIKKTFLFAILFSFHFVLINAQVSSLLGYWVTIDDNSGEKESIMKIFKAEDGKYYGKVVEILIPEYKHEVCFKCTGHEKDQPVEGMILIKGLKEESGDLVGGKAIDPKSGKVYNCKISFDAGKNKLKLRGSLDKRGVLGRTQYWERFKK